MDRRLFLGAIVAAPTLVVAADSVASTARRLRFTLTFSNPLNRPLAEQAFWCYLPAELADMQRLSDLQVSMPHAVQKDTLGHQILTLSFPTLPPLGRKLVTVTALVELPVRLVTSRERRLDDPLAWLHPERWIESDAAEIGALAATLRRQHEIETARAIYDWVRSNLNYAGFLADDRGALAALASRSGDCTEYADLVVALARACGVPARMVGGYVTERDTAPRSQDYHNWAQLYFDGAWRTVDAQKECWLAAPGSYIVFRLYRDLPTNQIGLAHRYRVQGEMDAIF